MDYRPTGSLSPRIDSNGNLGFFDPSGNEVAIFIAGKLSTSGNYVRNTNAGGQNTTSLTSVSSGVGISYTPKVSTSASIFFNVAAQNSTAADSWYAQIYYNTTGIPANGTAVGADTAIPTTIGGGINTSTSALAVGAATKATSLTVGTTYFFYIAFRAVIGGTATLGLVELIVTEG